jgi:hypothetical protein
LRDDLEIENKVIVSASLVGGFVMMWGTRRHDDIVSSQRRTPIVVTRIYTGPDGQTHAEEITVKMLPASQKPSTRDPGRGQHTTHGKSRRCEHGIGAGATMGGQ